VVGDAIWDMLAAKRSGMLGVGLLTGGTSRSALTEAEAYPTECIMMPRSSMQKGMSSAL
jgi:HAD-hyrolase-like protein